MHAQKRYGEFTTSALVWTDRVPARESRAPMNSLFKWHKSSIWYISPVGLNENKKQEKYIYLIISTYVINIYVYTRQQIGDEN